MNYGGFFDIDARREEVASLEERMARPGFWDRQEEAREVIERTQALKSWTEPWTEISARIAELEEIADLLADADDAELEAEFERGTERVGRELDDLELRNMLQGPGQRA